ncbi:unnamed protein product [Linum trigynum]|uniref:Uncharacterized protein n=1 Tax=Linum trigynum TaxID=586398 RepID=A0AAV2FYC1_9ROSI
MSESGGVGEGDGGERGSLSTVGCVGKGDGESLNRRSGHAAGRVRACGGGRGESSRCREEEGVRGWGGMVDRLGLGWKCVDVVLRGARCVG